MASALVGAAVAGRVPCVFVVVSKAGLLLQPVALLLRGLRVAAGFAAVVVGVVVVVAAGRHAAAGARAAAELQQRKCLYS